MIPDCITPHGDARNSKSNMHQNRHQTNEASYCGPWSLSSFRLDVGVLRHEGSAGTDRA